MAVVVKSLEEAREVVVTVTKDVGRLSRTESDPSFVISQYLYNKRVKEVIEGILENPENSIDSVSRSTLSSYIGSLIDTMDSLIPRSVQQSIDAVYYAVKGCTIR